MARAFLCLLVLVLLPACDSSPTESGPPEVIDQDLFASYQAFKDTLLSVTSIEDPTLRDQRVSALWDTLRAHQRFPFIMGDSLAFLYRGPASTVRFVGDFNGWNPNTRLATRLAPSDVWLQEEVFPRDARLDYKVVRDGSVWILDPENPLKQRSGFGDNSELRMPGYTPSPYVVRQDGIPRGNLSTTRSVASAALGYTVNYRVYTPVGYEDLSNLPSLYVTDGHEYADDVMGSLVVVLDNMIAEGLIEPVVAVFIDPRVGGQNIRSDQYIMNSQFARFVADELVPTVDAAFRTEPARWRRAILGTSLGGLNSAYFGVEITDTFRLLGIQSPAFYVGGGGIYDRYQDSPRLDLRIFMSWGTFHDMADGTEQMQAIFDAKGYEYRHVIVNEGHSWGNWRALLDNLLLYFWAEDA